VRPEELRKYCENSVLSDSDLKTDLFYSYPTPRTALCPQKGASIFQMIRRQCVGLPKGSLCRQLTSREKCLFRMVSRTHILYFLTTERSDWTSRQSRVHESSNNDANSGVSVRLYSFRVQELWNTCYITIRAVYFNIRKGHVTTFSKTWDVKRFHDKSITEWLAKCELWWETVQLNLSEIWTGFQFRQVASEKPHAKYTPYLYIYNRNHQSEQSGLLYSADHRFFSVLSFTNI
jgi:hypothetical protein